ncbi:MAG: HAD-IA family hydrolase, partial [Candidatus Binataceae bacterium]
GNFTDFDGYFDELFAFFADPAHWIAVTGAPALLAALRERGLKLGVVSNFDYRLYHILDGLGLSQYFDSVTISSEAGYAKPAPGIFTAAMAAAFATAPETLHVGDSEPLDLGGAMAAGISAVLVDPAYDGPPLITGRLARIGKLTMLPEVIERLPFP